MTTPPEDQLKDLLSRFIMQYNQRVKIDDKLKVIEHTKVAIKSLFIDIANECTNEDVWIDAIRLRERIEKL